MKAEYICAGQPVTLIFRLRQSGGPYIPVCPSSAQKTNQITRNLTNPQTIKNEAKTPALFKTVTILGIVISRQLACGRGAAPIMGESCVQISVAQVQAASDFVF
jgi:hypothetical protein